MGRNIRIHKDITLRWRVSTNGEAEALSGRDLILYLTDTFGDKTILPFAVTDTNLVTAVYYGRDQRKLGAYIITLAENVGKEGENAVDTTDAFTLVSRTEQETESTSTDLTAETIDLTGDLATNGRGASAYEVWLSLGNEGTEQDFIDSLKGAKGDTGETGATGAQGEKGDKGDTGAPGADGKDGIYITNVAEVVVTKESGGENVIRMTLSNGKYYDFYVYNGSPAHDIFYATYGSTSYGEIYDAVQAGKSVLCIYNMQVYRLYEYEWTRSYAYFASSPLPPIEYTIDDKKSESNSSISYLTVLGSTWSNTKAVLANASNLNAEITRAKEAEESKQDTLVSGTNIKTINNQSLLGSGNITIEGGGSATDAVKYTEQSLTASQQIQARANIGAAEDDNTVHKTEDETIYGSKDFVDPTTFEDISVNQGLLDCDGVCDMIDGKTFTEKFAAKANDSEVVHKNAADPEIIKGQKLFQNEISAPAVQSNVYSSGSDLMHIVMENDSISATDDDDNLVPINVGTPTEDSHTANKAYVDAETERAKTAEGEKLPLSGGTMTGNIGMKGQKLVGATDATFVNFLDNGNLRFEAPCDTNGTAYFTFGKAGANLGNGTKTILGVTDHVTAKASMDMTSHNITNVATPSNDADAANKAYVDGNFVSCSVAQSLPSADQAIARANINAQEVMIAGDNITIAADGKTISASGGGGSTPIVDNLDSDSSTSALSAKQGKVLKGLVDGKAETGDSYTKSEEDTLLGNKQDTISDLSTIRSGAAKGETALQSVPSTYRTAAEQDVIDATKVDVETGKGLSTNDFTDDYKSHVDDLWEDYQGMLDLL